MSTMFFRNVFYRIVWIILLLSSLHAQDWKMYFKQYMDGNIDSLQFDKITVRDENDPYYLTIKAAFTKEASVAKTLYEKALQNSSDEKLSEFIIDKIYDYYYARGLYLTAQNFKKRWERILKNSKYNENINSKKEGKGVYLQFGVFSRKENAMKFIEINKDMNIHLKILHKDYKFYVVSGPYFDENEARELSKFIKKKGKLKPFVKIF